MKYNQVVPGTFLQRPNRFIAHVLISGKEEVCHVKNTGRCRELLIPGCTVYCAVSDNPQRKTKYDLIAVEKIIESQTVFANAGIPSQHGKSTPEAHGTLLVNMDSQAPNAAVKEWLQSGASPFGNIDYIKPEYKYGNSRFDFYLECKTETKRTGTAPTPTENETTRSRKIFLEVKGVTLENNGVVLFVIQMERALYFTPNRKTHPQFADALCDAQNAGVQLLAYTCKVTPDEMKIDKELKVRL